MESKNSIFVLLFAHAGQTTMQTTWPWEAERYSLFCC